LLFSEWLPKLRTGIVRTDMDFNLDFSLDLRLCKDRARRFAISLLAVMMLAGCAAPESELNFSSDRSPQIYPANYRTDALSFMRTYLNNPVLVREAAISEPVLRNIGGRQRYVACLRYNARDSSNRYTGVSDRLAVFFEGRFDQLVEKAADQCSGATYAPFPELERLGR
jgi:hypothetical protein